MSAFDLRTAEEIKDGESFPSEYVMSLAHEAIGGLEVASWLRAEEGKRFIVTACMSDGGLTKLRHTIPDVINVGDGDFITGVLLLMHDHAKDPLLEKRRTS